MREILDQEFEELAPTLAFLLVLGKAIEDDFDMRADLRWADDGGSNGTLTHY